MRVLNILRRRLSPHVTKIHNSRLACIFAVVQALLRGNRLSLTRLGRSCDSRVADKHNIKRVDRLLGNKHLHAEQKDIYAGLARVLLKGIKMPTILVDWTKTLDGFWALAAAIPCSGRALTIYCEVHPERLLGNDRVQRRFLKRLKTNVVPKDCTPIIITDAGFRNPWFADVRKLDWHFVGRLVPDVKLHKQKLAIAKGAPADEWLVCESIPPPRRPKDMGTMTIARNNPFEARVVAYKPKPKKRTSQPPTPTNGASRKAIRQAQRTAVLATSLNDWSADDIVYLYRLRMRIEEFFRDAKNYRFGWSFRHARSASAKRISVLLLLASLAMVAAIAVGSAAEALGLHHGYVVNTERRRRTLSLFYLGCIILGRLDRIVGLPVDDLERALQELGAVAMAKPAT